MSAWICDSRVWQQGFCNTGLALAGRASIGGLEMKKTMRRWAAIVLAVTIAVAFMPAGFGALGISAPGSGPGVEKAYASPAFDLTGIIRGEEVNSDGTFYSGDTAYVYMEDLDKAYGGGFKSKYKEGKVECYFESCKPGTFETIKKLTAFYDESNERFYYKIHPDRVDTDLVFYTQSVNNEDSTYNNNSDGVYVSSMLKFTISKAGVVTVTGKSTNHTFSDVKLDGGKSVIPSSQKGKNNISFTFSVADRKQYSTGYYTIRGHLDNGNTCEPLNKVPVSIYTKPSVKAKMFKTNNKSVTFSPGSFNTAAYGDIYLDIKKGSKGKWSTAWGPFGPGSSKKLKKTLTPGSTYYVRAYYVKEVSGTYFIGPVSSTVKIKTGPKKKPAIKSIKISKAKVKKIKVKGKYYWDNGTLKYLKGFTTYETTYKVTIKFKKKQKIAGIEVYAGGVTLPKFIKGAKKTYTAKFTVGGKAKGKRTNFKIRTKGNASYGAWSPTYKSKKIRIR